MALGVILDCVHGGAGLVPGVHMGDLYTPSSPVQEGSNNFRFVAYRADDGGDARQLGRPDHVFGVVHRDGAVLIVDQDPVESQVAQHLHNRRRWEGNHHPKDGVPGFQLLFEGVLLHVDSLAEVNLPWSILFHLVKSITESFTDNCR